MTSAPVRRHPRPNGAVSSHRHRRRRVARRGRRRHHLPGQRPRHPAGDHRGTHADARTPRRDRGRPGREPDPSRPSLPARPPGPACHALLSGAVDHAGVKGPGGQRVKLEAARLAGKWITTPAAIGRFVEAQTPRPDDVPPPRLAPQASGAGLPTGPRRSWSGLASDRLGRGKTRARLSRRRGLKRHQPPGRSSRRCRRWRGSFHKVEIPTTTRACSSESSP